MKKVILVLISVALAALLGLTACAPVWGTAPSGGGGIMMGGQSGGMMGPQQPSQGQPYPNQPGSQQPYQYGSGGTMGPGMMGGGMMGSGGMMSGMPMMGGMTGYYSGVLKALSHDDAKEIADGYLGLPPPKGVQL